MPRPYKYPCLMIVEGKDIEWYNLLNDEEDLHKVAFELVKMRAGLGYWYPTLERLENDRQFSLGRLESNEYTDLTDEQVEALPESLKEKAVAARTKYTRSLAAIESRYREGKLLIDAVTEVVNAPEGTMPTREGRDGRKINVALAILNTRADHQYEGFRFETFDNVDYS